MPTNSKQSNENVVNSSEQVELNDENLSEYENDYEITEEHARRIAARENNLGTEFVISGKTKIGWGKLKGRQHNQFLNPKNRAYAQWVIDQGEAFRYNNSRKWIIENLDKMSEDIGNMPIKSLSKKQIQSWLNGL